MKKFYDREQETAELLELQRQSFEDYSRFVVLTGRRRVGKTSLVSHMLSMTEREAPGLYFFVGKKTEAVLVEGFAEEVRTKLGEYVPNSIKKFRELFQLLLEIGKRRSFTLFIDEFQEFAEINSGVFSDIQELWDGYKKETKICLVASGSIFRMMEKIFKDEEQPLFGRADSMMHIQPFRTNVLQQILADYNAEYTNDDLLALWTYTGGVARYIELFMNNGCYTASDMISYICRKSDGFFIEEGRNILLQEFGKQYGTYFSILGQIARGDVTQRQIESEVGVENLGGQLKLLEEKYRIIKKKRPIGAKPGAQSVRYEITDNFFRFWFRYIFRYSSLIEIQNMPALERKMKDDYTTFSGLALEGWFKKRMMESCRYMQIGSWWLPNGRKQEVGSYDAYEIDIITEDLDGNVAAYEVKRNIDKYKPLRLEEKIKELQKTVFKGKTIAINGLSLDNLLKF